MSQATLLEGIVVVDATQVMAGPYCAMLLADMGARVIKVEPPAGDSTRAMAGGVAGESHAFNGVNRGKQGLVLDLRSADGREVFHRLVRRADIVVENFRPGVMARFGLDYAALSADQPGLIYASISGYGQTGPWAGRGGFDLVAQGVTGIMSVTGEPGRPPVKAGLPITDLGAGLFALAGILAALHHRDRTGHGQHIDTSLMEAGLALSVWEAAEYFGGRGVPGPLGSAHRMSAPYQAFRCADGYVTVGAANQRTFEKLAAAARPSRVDRRPALRQRRRAGPPPRGAGRADRGGDGNGHAGRLVRPLRCRRHPVRADPRLRRGVRHAAGAGPRHGRDGGASGARPHPHHRHAAQALAHAARRRSAGRRGSASTPTRCCRGWATPRLRWQRCARQGALG